MFLLIRNNVQLSHLYPTILKNDFKITTNNAIQLNGTVLLLGEGGGGGYTNEVMDWEVCYRSGATAMIELS